MKKSAWRARLSSSSTTTTTTTTTTVTYKFQNDHSIPHPQPKITEIPITVHLPNTTPTPPQSSDAAAAKIQSAYRSHVVRTLIKKISAVNSESTRLERLIQQQDTVDAIRSNDRERIRINEALMGLLLSLDSVPGVDPTVRELRRSVSRRIVGLQEILDGVSECRVENWDGFLREWDEVIEGMEEQVCVERGGYEMERFCAENLGFRCLQRFLRDQ